MRHLRLVHPQPTEAPVTAAEHELQRRLVEMSTLLATRRQERRDEGAAQSRLYSSRRTHVENVVPLRPGADPGRPAA